MALLLAAGTFHSLFAADLPSATGTISVPTGWRIAAGEALTLLGPGGGHHPPRLALRLAETAPAEAAAVLRAGWQRVADGCTVLDDDDEPLGGRVWRRIRVRYAVGPLAVAQTAWVGSVGGRTVVAVLSSDDDAAAAALATAAAAIASISVPR